ncbi:MAG: CBS domain-containing protein [Bacillus sp. (in: Bacteria)]|nr:CBS domain-containing protein [Bacillus sp. (in: firmicutes)]
MKIIVSHTNLDFDGLASMIGASKLYPQATMILPEKLSPGVANFLAIYKDTFPFQRKNSINWELVTEIILVDVNCLHRIDCLSQIQENVSYIVYDHHPITDDTVPYETGEISSTGATITILTEHIQAASVTISSFEATVFALALYSDTGDFTYEQTTSRDFRAAAYFFENKANLSVVQQFKELPLSPKEGELFHLLLEQSTLHSVDDIDILVCWHEQSDYTGHLAHITRKLLDRTGADAVFSIVRMGKKVFITARSSSNRVDVLPLFVELGGGGHNKAASAMKKGENLTNVLQQVKGSLNSIILPPITAKDLMSSPVRVVALDTTIEDVSKMLYRYGHTGFPVMDNETLVGIISRRDVDKALHHRLGHAPVKGFMSRNPLTISEDVSLEQIQEYMIEYQIGRLPVTSSDDIVGIVSRTDVIQALHGRKGKMLTNKEGKSSLQLMDFSSKLKELLPSNYYTILQIIGETANNKGIKAYLIGGMVRDLILKRKNHDMDIVIEGDAIQFAHHLKEIYGGHVRSHEEFGTATWKHPTQIKVDFTSARTEYYDFPAALPKVERSTIKEDLLRRDFTINAMAICLHKKQFGQLLDYFHGYEDLKKKKIRVLYNLSFVEDPTRILRAIRFESRFDFLMDKHTESLAIQSGTNLLELSKPRIANELKKTFY